MHGSFCQDRAYPARCRYLFSQAYLAGASPTATWQRSEMGNQGVEVMITTEGSPQATAPKPSLSTSNEALTVRRNAHFYSWRGNCYTQDRDQNWYQVDARL